MTDLFHFYFKIPIKGKSNNLYALWITRVGFNQTEVQASCNFICGSGQEALRRQQMISILLFFTASLLKLST